MNDTVRQEHTCPKDKTKLMPSTTGRHYCPKCRSLWEIRRTGSTYIFSIWPPSGPQPWKRNDSLTVVSAGEVIKEESNV